MQGGLRRLAVAGPAVALLLGAAGAGIAAAEDPGESIRLEYSAGPGCPDQEAFVARVRARAARARFVGDGAERAQTFVVKLTAGAHPSGSVTVRDDERSGGLRQLDADTCEDVADALALMVALALDPRALTPAPPASSGAFDAASPPEVDAGPPVLVDSAAPEASAPPSSPSPSPSPSPPAPESPARAPRQRHFFGGVDFAVTTGVAPDALFAGAPYLGWRSTRPSLLGPSIRASFLRAGTGAVGAPGGSAVFTWTVGRLDACAMLWPDRPLRLGACGRAEAGILDVAGQQIAGASTQHSGWFALEPLARLEWSFLGPLMLDAGVGPSFRITADRFYFLPGATVYEVPYVGFVAEAGVGVHFL